MYFFGLLSTKIVGEQKTIDAISLWSSKITVSSLKPVYQLNNTELPWNSSLLSFYKVFQLCFLVVSLTYNGSFLLWPRLVLTQIRSPWSSLWRSKWQYISYTKEKDCDLKFNNYFVHYFPMTKKSVFFYLCSFSKNLFSEVQFKYLLRVV